MQLQLDKCEIRSFREADAESIAQHANNRKIWINLRDEFPHPNHIDDTREFIRVSLEFVPELHFAIVVDGQAVGAIGFRLHDDIERVSAEVGYWLGEAYWGRGIITDVLKAMTAYAVKTYKLTRVYALPFEWNLPSMKVLEKAGYELEGRMRRAAKKDGKIIDLLLYSYVTAD